MKTLTTLIVALLCSPAYAQPHITDHIQRQLNQGFDVTLPRNVTLTRTIVVNGQGQVVKGLGSTRSTGRSASRVFNGIGPNAALFIVAGTGNELKDFSIFGENKTQIGVLVPAGSRQHTFTNLYIERCEVAAQAGEAFNDHQCAKLTFRNFRVDRCRVGFRQVNVQAIGNRFRGYHGMRVSRHFEIAAGGAFERHRCRRHDCARRGHNADLLH